MTIAMSQSGWLVNQQQPPPFFKKPDFHSPLPARAHGVPIRSRHVKKPKPLEMLKDFTVPLKTWPVGFLSKTSLEVAVVF